MKLLFDTDAFCKLGVASLLPDVACLFGEQLQACGRLAALPYMLKKGTLPRRYGEEACGKLLPIANAMPPAPEADPASLSLFSAVEDIDSGEAQLFAAAAQHGLSVVTHDKRALRALAGVPSVHPQLCGRIVVLESALVALCARLGAAALAAALAPLSGVDRAITDCLSRGSGGLLTALASFSDGCACDVEPLKLWSWE